MNEGRFHLLLMTFSTKDEGRWKAVTDKLRTHLFLEINSSTWLVGVPAPAKDSIKEILDGFAFTPDDEITFFDVTQAEVFPYWTRHDLKGLILQWRRENQGRI